MTLEEFLLARVSEDEAAARAAIADDCGSDEGFTNQFQYLTRICRPRFAEDAARMITRFAVPARVLAECEAKRRIVEEYAVTLRAGELMAYQTLDDVVRELALPHADHPDYREEWRP